MFLTIRYKKLAENDFLIIFNQLFCIDYIAYLNRSTRYIW